MSAIHFRNVLLALALVSVTPAMAQDAQTAMQWAQEWEREAARLESAAAAARRSADEARFIAEHEWRSGDMQRARELMQRAESNSEFARQATQRAAEALRQADLMWQFARQPTRPPPPSTPPSPTRR